MRARGTERPDTIARAVLLGLLVCGISGCFYVSPPNQAFGVRVSAPAPHAHAPRAPAHGDRHKQTGLPDLVYDSRLGVYVVLGYPDYFHDGRLYFRVVSGRWQSSVELDGTWKSCSHGDLPHGLAAKVSRRRSHQLPASPEF